VKTRRVACAIIAAALIASSAVGDVVVLRNGRRVEGAISQESATEVVIKTPLGVLRIPRNQVVQIERTATSADEIEGDAARSAGDLLKARQCYQKALQATTPGSDAATRLQEKLSQVESAISARERSARSGEVERVRTLVANKRYSDAIRLCEQLLASGLDDNETSTVRRLKAEAHFGRAHEELDRMNLLGADAELRKAVEAYEPFYRAHLLLGERLLQSVVSQKEGVEEILKGLKYGEGEISEAELVKYHYMVARVLYQQGKYQEAASHFVECVRGKDKYPVYADALDYAADSFVKMGEQNVVGDAKKTVENLLRAIELDPQKAQAWFLLGRMYKDLGETTKAIEAFTKVVKLQPNYPYAYQALAGAHRDKQNLDEALNAINEELKQRPDNYDALVERAEIQIELKNFDQAAQDLDNAMRRDPTRWQAYMVRANLAYVQEDYDTAQQNIEQVLRLKPDAVEAHLIIGKILTAKKDTEAARQWFSNVIEYLEQQPNLTYKFKTVVAEAYTRMAEIDLTEDSPRQAETRLRRALEFVADYAPALAKIGDVKKRLANDLDTAAAKKRFYREAEEYYRKAIEVNPRDPDLYLALGILYHKNLKDTRKAVINYQKYLDLGGKDRATVGKWIEECGGVVEAGIEETTATATTHNQAATETNKAAANSKSKP